MPWDALPDALLLARIQFAFTVTFHFLFPAFTIGLASYLAVLEGLWLWTGRPIWTGCRADWTTRDEIILLEYDQSESLAWVLSHFFGVMGIFIAAGCANVISGGIGALWFRFALRDTMAKQPPRPPEAAAPEPKPKASCLRLMKAARPSA